LLVILSWPGLVIVLAGLFALAHWIHRQVGDQRTAEAGDSAPPKRATSAIVKLGAALAESHGVADEPARAVQWTKRVPAYGRLVPHPRKQSEIRVAFAGTLRTAPDTPWPSLGSRVKAGQMLGRLPSGVSYAFSGEHEARRMAQRELLLLSLAAGAGVVLLVWMAFGSLRRLLLLLLNLPFAMVGRVAVVYLAGGMLDVGALIGFVTLFGITMRNGIMMTSHWQHLQEVEGMVWGLDLVFRGARERPAPVLMTALVTALGLLPIALGSGQPGREIEGPWLWSS
jgi:hypothetical protein